MEQLLMKIRGIVNNNKQQKHVAFYSVVYAYMYNFLTYQIFTLGRFCLLLFKIDNVKKKLNLLGAPDLQLIFNQLLFKDGFYKQAASGLGFTFGEYTWLLKHVVGFTRECERGTFSITGKNLKISNFVCQSYLRDFLTDNFPWKHQVLSARQL